MRYAMLALACFCLAGCNDDAVKNVTDKVKDAAKEVVDTLKAHGAEQCKQYATIASCSVDTNCKWVDGAQVSGCVPK